MQEQESEYSVLSRGYFPCGCRSCRGLYFSRIEVTKQEEMLPQSKHLFSSLAHAHSWEEKGTLQHQLTVAIKVHRLGKQATMILPVRAWWSCRGFL